MGSKNRNSGLKEIDHSYPKESMCTHSPFLSLACLCALGLMFESHCQLKQQNEKEVHFLEDRVLS